MRRYLLVPFLAIALLLLSGCSSYVDSDQTGIDPASEVGVVPGHPVGQTFVARHGGLDGMDVWLRALPGSQGQLRLHVRESADSGQDLAVSTLALSDAATSGSQHFAFSPIADSNSRYLYAFIDLDGQGEVRVSAAPGTTYRDGSLYRDHVPVADGQMAFRLSYAKVPMQLSFGRQALGDLWLLAIAALIFVVPGWGLIAWLRRDHPLSWAEILGLAPGMSLAFYPVWMLWTDAIGLHLGSLNVWLPVAIGVLALVLHYARHARRDGRSPIRWWRCADSVWPDIGLLVVLAFVLGARFMAAHALHVPSWGDSVQHAVIAQLMLDHGGLFASWEPYAPYYSLSIHYGFSADAAILAWATGTTGVAATLLAGQLINGIAVLSLYPLATRLAAGRRWAGVGAVLVAGLLSPMPAYYVNWGRFAQMTGQAILPVALWLLLEVLEEKPSKWWVIMLSGLAVAGMTLSYFRMPYFYGAFLLAWLITCGIPRWRSHLDRWLTGLQRLVPAGILTVLLFLPYRTRLAGSSLEAGLTSGTANSSALGAVIAQYQVWRDLATYVPQPLQVAFAVALGWSLWRRRWDAVTAGLWTFTLALLVASQLIHVPGARYLENFAVLIALYMPISIVIGGAFGELVAWGTLNIGGLIQSGTLAVVLVLGGLGAVQQAGIVDPQFILVNQPDMRAMDWMREHSAPDARFLVEGFRVYNGRWAVGSDAGWWIPLLAGRANTMPPQYAMLNEVPTPRDYGQRMVALVAQLETASPAAPESVRKLCEAQVTHVYIGQGQGAIGAGARTLYSADTLLASPLFHLAYHQDRVYIFMLDPSACQQTRHG